MTTEEKKKIDNIKERLKELRTEKGLTQNQLSEKIFVDRSDISRWEGSGKLPEDIKYYERLADVYGVSIDYIMCRDNTRSVENGKIELPFSRAIELAKFYNISLDYLAGITDTPRTLDGNIYTVHNNKNITAIKGNINGGNVKINIKN